MAKKVRKQIYIEPRQEAILKRLARQRGTSEAEVIRQAIDRHVGALRPQKPDLAAWQEERVFIQSLIERGPVVGRRTWRREELYER